MAGSDPGCWSGRPISRRILLKTMVSAIAVLGCGSLLVACDKGAEVVVEMNDELKYAPAMLIVKVGTTVEWRNTGKMAHTVTDDPMQAHDKASARLPEGAESWDSGDIEGGQSWSRRFDVPGEYTYFCIPHELAGMVARLTVES